MSFTTTTTTVTTANKASTTLKSLRIMRDDYYTQPYKSSDSVINDDSLMSPPLTPTDLQHSVSSSPIISDAKEAEETEEEMEDWYCNNNAIISSKRKQFIASYSRMVPFLRHSKSSNNNSNNINNGCERVFALNVYRDILLNQQPIIKAKKNLFKKGRKGNDCAMSDETVVSHTKKRRLMKTAASNMSDIDSATSALIEDKELSVNKKRKRVSSFLPSGKDAAQAFDSIDIDCSDIEFYPDGWAPNRIALDQVPVKVSWKGAPLAVCNQPYCHLLHPVESSMASILRLSPVQYLRCKRILIMAARTLKIQEIPFTKSVAQKLCRVDVNKTSSLWTAFGQLGWFTEESSNDATVLV